MANRVTPFSIGRRWYCERTSNPYARPNFTFVIIGPGEGPNKKLCRLESDDPQNDSSHNSEQEFSHDHLKKCARLME